MTISKSEDNLPPVDENSQPITLPTTLGNITINGPALITINAHTTIETLDCNPPQNSLDMHITPAGQITFNTPIQHLVYINFTNHAGQQNMLNVQELSTPFSVNSDLEVTTLGLDAGNDAG